jgi:hypothetical protein
MEGFMAARDGSNTNIRQETSGDIGPNVKSVRTELHWLEALNFASQIILAFIGVIAVCVYIGQLNEMKHTNQLTQKSLDGNELTLSRTLAKMQGQIDAINAGNSLSKDAVLATQRAFLYVGKFNISTVGDVYKVNFVWSNGGTTPTRFMRETTHIQLFKREMPKQFALYNSAERGTQMFVGPKGDSWGKSESFPATDLAAVAAHQGHFYIWGWAKYFDIFPKTNLHITQFCTEVTNVIYSQGTVNFVTTACKRGNCTDDECKIQ